MKSFGLIYLSRGRNVIQKYLTKIIFKIHRTMKEEKQRKINTNCSILLNLLAVTHSIVKILKHVIPFIIDYPM
jgi:hypothetical protein